MNTQTQISAIIFKNSIIEIFAKENTRDAKGLFIKCSATNPQNGNVYEKYAGWVGVSLAIHGGSKTPSYILEAAQKEIAANERVILQAIIDFLNKIGWESRAQDFLKENGRASRRSVGYKISHPLGEGERQYVRKMMQQNAPNYTNHL